MCAGRKEGGAPDQSPHAVPPPEAHSQRRQPACTQMHASALFALQQPLPCATIAVEPSASFLWLWLVARASTVCVQYSLQQQTPANRQQQHLIIYLFKDNRQDTPPSQARVLKLRNQAD